MVTFRRGHWLLRVKILNVPMDRSPRPPNQSIEVLKQYADDPLLETSVSREMVLSWTIRQAANVKKRDEQLSAIEASGPFGF